MNKRDTVTFELDAENPGPLSPEQKAELSALAGLPDDEIDTSDIPPLSDSFWKGAERNPFYRP
jgi:hypothetical protein